MPRRASSLRTMPIRAMFSSACAIRPRFAIIEAPRVIRFSGATHAPNHAVLGIGPPGGEVGMSVDSIPPRAKPANFKRQLSPTKVRPNATNDCKHVKGFLGEGQAPCSGGFVARRPIERPA